MKFAASMLLLSALVLGVPSANAAYILGAYQGPVTADYNLTDAGLNDWAYWDFLSNSSQGPSVAPSNSKLGGTMIGDMYGIGGTGNLRGSSSTTKPSIDFSYTDGTSPTSGTVTQATGLFSTTLNTVGVGPGFDVNLPTANPYQVDVWVSLFASTGRFSASLDSTELYLDTSTVDVAGGTKESYIYRLYVYPDTPNQTLSIHYTMEAGTASTSDHVVILGAAAKALVIPEPTSMAMLLTGVVLMGTARKLYRLNVARG